MSINPDIGRFYAFCQFFLVGSMPHIIKDFHKELIGLVAYNRIAIAAPRSFAKSTYFSFAYPLYLSLTRPGIKILLVSATGSLAEHWLGRIRKEFETNELLISETGDQKGAKWSVSELELNNGSTIMAKGAGKQIRGFRPDVVVGDDLETDEIVASPELLRKFTVWFWTDLIGTLTADCQMIIVGTILHPDSFLSDLVNNGKPGWETRFYAAIREDGSALWEDQWPLDKLDLRRREMGDYLFAQEYMNDPIPDEFRTFKKEWFNYYEELPEDLIFFTTVDPAIEIGNINDFTAIVTVGVNIKEEMYIANYIARKLLPKETIDFIFEEQKRWESAIIGIESVGFQKMLKNEVERERRRRRQYPIITELKSGGRRKHLRIEALQPRYQNGTIFHRKGMKELETQLLRFPSPRCKDDIIDALAYQLDIIRPAQKDVEKVNPECFIATVERRRRKSRSSVIWGNHNLRRR